MQVDSYSVQELISTLPNFSDPDYSLGKAENVIVKGTVTYIVGGIVLRGTPSNLEVVLVQEAKLSCHGKWYLPCGRLEPNETLVEGCLREVKEEANVDCSVGALMSVHVQGGGWCRFVFKCTIIGGTLKTQNEADSESLQALWFPLHDVINKKVALRSNDIISLLSDARKQFTVETPSFRVLPNPRQVQGMFIRLLVVHFKNDSQKSVVIAVRATNSGLCLPIVEYNLNTFVPVAVSKLYRVLFVDGASDLLIPNRCIGVDSLPIPAREHDGLCITLLALVKPNRKPQFSRPNEYSWMNQNEANKSFLQKVLTDAPYFKMD